MTKIIKCVCGRKTVIKPKDDINRLTCPLCKRTGEYRRLSDDEAKWD